MKFLHQVVLPCAFVIFSTFLPHLLQADNTNLDTLYIAIPDLEGQIGDTITLDFQVRNFKEVVGLQFDFRFDTSMMSFVGLKFGDLEVIGWGSFGFQNVEEGSVRFSWADFNDNSFTMEDHSYLFSITMKTEKPIASLDGMVAISEEVITAEYISSSLELGQVKLVIDELSTTSEAQALLDQMQLFPNPSTGETLLKFSLAASSPVTISVYNDLGQQLSSQRLNLGAGQHTLPLHLTNAGRYWCRIQVPDGSQTRAIVVQN
ncbi:MAG: T9SS type A sorting domain-containing protein [Saprospiraceae bacterium]|nr:T9SS type A sorting domain-containing protein [Saprospiraceae bacterium]